MTGVPRFAWPFLAALAAAAVHGTLSAQTAVLRGRVVDSAGRPVAGVPVVLHGVSREAGGAELGRTTSDAEGRFEVDAPPAEGDAIYFAATRFEGALYVGAPFRDPARAPADYVIVVGANAVGGAAASPSRPAAPDSLPWWLTLAVGVPAIGAVLLPLLPRERSYAVRTLLLELAELEERHTGDAAGSDLVRRRRYVAEREALRARLRTIPESTASHAADQH